MKATDGLGQAKIVELFQPVTTPGGVKQFLRAGERTVPDTASQGLVTQHPAVGQVEDHLKMYVESFVGHQPQDQRLGIATNSG